MNPNKKYISCIKISGKPILPPLITPEIRKECFEFQRKAISIEKKLERNKVFAKCLEDLVKLQKQTENLAENPNTVPITSLENQIITDEINNSEDITLSDRPNKLKHLTTETIDVSEYINEGVRVLSSENTSISTENKSQPQTTPRPKLIRSNSYTLESPSPILLAHLEREAAQVTSSLDQSLSLSLSPVTIVGNETPTQEIIETDVKIEHISVTTPLNSSIEKFDPIKNCDLEPHLLETLKHLPENCIKNIIEIFEKQRTSQSETIQHINEKVLGNCVESTDKPLSLSITSNQSVYYSIQSTSPLKDDESIVNLNNVRNSVQNPNENELSKKDRAASIIGAYARGYLIRRLIKTEKVQALIDTIKDALLCALQLHSAQVIDESDIELHRRLIQQVSAACYAFHDVFFLLSVKEQMAIISLDRQRRIEKAKRPVSSSANSRVSTPGRSFSEKLKLTR